MASNRLYIYDPATNKAVCIAKGYSSGWSCGRGDYLDRWFDDAVEFTGGIESTRYVLKTEENLPTFAETYYQDDSPTLGHRLDRIIYKIERLLTRGGNT